MVAKRQLIREMLGCSNIHVNLEVRPQHVIMVHINECIRRKGAISYVLAQDFMQ